MEIIWKFPPRCLEALWHHPDIARATMEVRAKFGLNDLEAIRGDMNGGGSVAIILKQAGHANLPASGAPQLLVPLVVHPTNMAPQSWKFHGHGLPQSN